MLRNRNHLFPSDFSDDADIKGVKETLLLVKKLDFQNKVEEMIGNPLSRLKLNTLANYVLLNEMQDKT